MFSSYDKIQSLWLWPIIFIFITSCRQFVSQETTSLIFPNFNSSCNNVFSLVNDCLISNNKILLDVKSSNNKMSGMGRAMYNQGIHVANEATNDVASFNTSFTFAITSNNVTYGGDGFAFVIAPDATSIGGPGGYLGLVTSSTNNRVSNHIFAVEFDTTMNYPFSDPSSSHIGVNINKMTSIQTYDFCSTSNSQCNYFINSGNFTAWIDYNSANQILDVWLANGDLAENVVKPTLAYIHMHDFNLSTIFNGYMYIGFSGGNGTYQETNTIYSWNFLSTLTIGQQPSPLSQPLSPASDPPPSLPPNNPSSPPPIDPPPPPPLPIDPLPPPFNNPPPIDPPLPPPTDLLPPPPSNSPPVDPPPPPPKNPPSIDPSPPPPIDPPPPPLSNPPPTDPPPPLPIDQPLPLAPPMSTLPPPPSNPSPIYPLPPPPSPTNPPPPFHPNNPSSPSHPTSSLAPPFSSDFFLPNPLSKRKNIGFIIGSIIASIITIIGTCTALYHYSASCQEIATII